MIDLVYPPRCPVTDDHVGRHGAFSAAAWGRARMISAPQCTQCGLPFAMSDPAAALCGPCAAPAEYKGSLTGKSRLDRIRSALVYDDEAARLVMGLKYADRHDHVQGLARLMALAGEDLWAPDIVLVPVPLYRRRLLTRRFNQAAMLSQALRRETGAVHAPRLLCRIKATPKQKGMSPSARRRNVAGAFALRNGHEAAGLRVVLVDDVLTSGATLIGCARALRRGGAAWVGAITLARVIKG